jgi:hypothetical protein
MIAPPLRPLLGPARRHLVGIRLRPVPQEPGDPLGRVSTEGRDDVGVEIGGDGHRRVPQAVGDHLDVDPGGQGKARVRVANVVEADGWQPRLFRKSLEVARDVLGPQRVAILAADPAGGCHRGWPRYTRQAAKPCIDSGTAIAASLHG